MPRRPFFPVFIGANLILFTFVSITHSHSIYEESGVVDFHRITLAGNPLYGIAPTDEEEIDVEPEETSIDVLTRQLRYNTTDIYVDLCDEDNLALAVRRNAISEAWREAVDLSPEERPDRPLGAGWVSGLAASVCIQQIEGLPWSEVIVTDEDGTRYRLIRTVNTSGKALYRALPWNETRQAPISFEMTESEEGIKLKRRFGTTLVFTATPAIAKRKGDRQWTFHRLNKVQSRDGIQLEYIYHHGNTTLIPDEIASGRLRIQIAKNQHGKVIRLIDPEGYPIHYSYKASGLEGMGPVLSSVENQPVEGKGSITSFTYLTESEKGVSYGNLASIVNPMGNAHSFTYTSDSTRSPDTGYFISPRILSSVKLPENKPGVTLHTKTSRNHNERWVIIKDAIGAVRIYKFSEKTILHSADLRENGPAIICFPTLEVCFYTGNTFDAAWNPTNKTIMLFSEKYQFSIAAGMRLNSYTDASKNTTTFDYTETKNSDVPLFGDLGSFFSDPASRTDALGQKSSYFYAPITRLCNRIESKGKRVTVYELHPVTGNTTRRTIYKDTNAEKAKQPLFREEYEYENPRFPWFTSKHIIRRIPGNNTAPEWETDLVKIYKAGDTGKTSVAISDPDGLKLTTRNFYSPKNAKVAVVHPNSYTVFFYYDPRGRISETFFPASQNSRPFTYDLVGETLSKFQDDGLFVEFSYDKMRRLIKKVVTDKSGKKQSFTYKYNNRSNQVFATRNDGSTAEYQFDAASRIIQIKEGSKTTSYKYEKNWGNYILEDSPVQPTTVILPNKASTEVEYDALYRKVAVFAKDTPSSKRTLEASYEYDAGDNLLKETIEGKTTLYQYDAMNRLVSETSPEGVVTEIFYTSTGLKHLEKSSDGTTKRYKYDAAGNEIKNKTENKEADFSENLIGLNSAQDHQVRGINP